MPSRPAHTVLARFLDSETSAGLLLMAVAFLAIVVANSPLAPAYFGLLHAYLGPLSVQHWINDALMALFFLLVGLEIKREMLEGQLLTWSHRILPGFAALGGMAVPALIYAAVNSTGSGGAHGWAIPTATDIAFALGVLSLLGNRVPTALKIFLTALAIIDDLGAVLIIAIFYARDIDLAALAGAAAVFVLLAGLNRIGVRQLTPYLALGVVLWLLMFLSGVHATIAGVLLALTIPLRQSSSRGDDHETPLHRLEHGLARPVSLVVVPLFGFANAGVSLAGIGPAALTEPVTLGVGLGLVLGKLVGVFGAVALAVRTGLAKPPAGAGWSQIFGVALLCGIGFTMSLFVALLAFADPLMQDRAKLGILAGSIISGIAGYLVLRLAARRAISSP